MESRKDDHSSRVHFQSKRFWSDSSGWYYSLRDNILNGPFTSQKLARAHFKKLMPEQSSEPLVHMAIGSKGLVFHCNLNSLNSNTLGLTCETAISQDCIEESCMVCVTSLLAGDVIDIELKCHIDKISKKNVDLQVQQSDTDNSQKMLRLIENMKHLAY